MESEFPYLKITDKLQRVVGARDDDTRIFRQCGSASDFSIWLMRLNEMVEDGVTPATWAPVVVGVFADGIS